MFASLSLNANASYRINESKSRKEVSNTKAIEQKVKIEDCCTWIGLTDVCGQCTNFHICRPTWSETMQIVQALQDLYELPVCYSWEP